MSVRRTATVVVTVFLVIGLTASPAVAGPVWSGSGVSDSSVQQSGPTGLAASVVATNGNSSKEVDRFEDNDMVFENDSGDIDGWTKESGTQMNAVSSGPINGSYSGSIRADNTQTVAYIDLQNDYQGPAKVSYSMNTSAAASTDASKGLLAGGEGYSILSVRFDASSGNIEIRGANITTKDTGIAYSSGEVFNITHEYHWDNTSAHVEIDGQRFGPFDFDQTTATKFKFYLDTAPSGNSERVRWDDFVIETGGGSPQNVNGQVVDENGDPVANATVKAVGIDYSELSGTIEEKRDKADDFRADAKHPYPETTEYPASNWTDGTPDFALRNTEDAIIDEAEAPYAAVHTADDWGQFYDNPDDLILNPETELDRPRVSPPAGQTLYVSVWAPSEEQIDLREDDIDEDLPGQTEDGKIVITRLNPSGEERRQRTVTTTPAAKITDAANFGSKVHEVAKVRLSPGFYHIHPEGSPETGYTIAVGDPEDIATPYAEQLENQADNLDAQADRIETWLNQNKANTYTTTTNATGEFTLNIPTSANEADLIAYKTPPGIDGENASHEAIIDHYQDNLSSVTESDLNGYSLGDINTLEDLDESGIDCSQLDSDVNYGGAYYASDPARSPTTDPPESNVTVGVTKVSMPSEVNASVAENLNDIASLCNEADAQSAETRIDQFVCENLDRSETEREYDRWKSILTTQDAFEDKYLELSDFGALQPASSLSDSDLCTEYRLMKQIIRNYDPSPTNIGGSSGPVNVGGSADTTVERVTDTEYVANVQKLIPGEINESATTVYAHYTNGTTQVVGESYIDIRETATGTTLIAVEDYPLHDTDPAAVQFEFVAPITDSSTGGSVDDGVTRVTERVGNPAFDGDAPTFESIRFTTLSPGPSQTVNMTVTPASDSSYKSISGATVYGPDGSTLSSSVIDGSEVGFETAGEGIHTIQVNVTDVDGNTHVLTERVTAGGLETSEDPIVRARSTAFGLYAVVGSGLQGGAIETRDGGSQVIVTAQLASDKADDPPSRIHVYLNGLSLPADTDTTVRVAAGSSQESVSSRVGLIIHGPPTQESAIQYRNGDQPMTVEGTQYGQAVKRADQTLYRTYTDASGEVDIAVNNNPGIIDRAWWTYRTSVRPRIPGLAPLSSGLPTGASPGGLLAAVVVGLLLGRRHLH